jgi:hypothetical protein
MFPARQSVLLGGPQPEIDDNSSPPGNRPSIIHAERPAITRD